MSSLRAYDPGGRCQAHENQADSLPAMRYDRPCAVSSETFYGPQEGAFQGEAKMEKRRFSLEGQLAGVKAALKSKKTPKQLRAGLRKRVEQLEQKLRES